MRLALRSSLVLSMLTLASAAHGQVTSGFHVNHFEPSERGSEWFALDSLDLRGHVRPAIGIVGEYAYRPLVIYNPDGTVRASLVRDVVTLHPGASLVLWERLRVGLDVPVQVYAFGHSGTLDGVTYPAPANSTAMSDIRVSADVRLAGEYGGPITAALGAALSIPTGDQGSYAGDKSVRVAPRLLIAGDISAFVYAASIGVTYRASDGAFANGYVGSELFGAISAGLRVADRKLVIGPEVMASSVFSGTDTFFSKQTTPVDGLLGAHYTIGEDWRIGAGGGVGFTRGIGSPASRGVASIEWVPGMPKKAVAPVDRDGDGIEDARDACPDAPGPFNEDPRKNGCPPPKDRDNDGIDDAADACPDVPGVKTDDPKTNGCPPDKDGDGVPDAVDACVDVAGVKTDDPKTNGCPPDKDGDGVLDKDDACPDVAGLKTSDPKTNGCPDPDRDKDGIPNDTDACPDEPGKPDPDPKRNGCPKAYIKSGQIRILDQVKFKTASAEIIRTNGGEDVLIAVMKVLQDHPEITKVRVEGHTDSRGAAAMNRKLSSARAASVVKWLVTHGIDSSRLRSEGYGPDKPIDTNETDIGRQNNRRVEFHIEEPAQNESLIPPGGPSSTSVPSTPPTKAPASGTPVPGSAAAANPPPKNTAPAPRSSSPPPGGLNPPVPEPKLH